MLFSVPKRVLGMPVITSGTRLSPSRQGKQNR